MLGARLGIDVANLDTMDTPDVRSVPGIKWGKATGCIAAGGGTFSRVEGRCLGVSMRVPLTSGLVRRICNQPHTDVALRESRTPMISIRTRSPTSLRGVASQGSGCAMRTSHPQVAASHETQRRDGVIIRTTGCHSVTHRGDCSTARVVSTREVEGQEGSLGAFRYQSGSIAPISHDEFNRACFDRLLFSYL